MDPVSTPNQEGARHVAVQMEGDTSLVPKRPVAPSTPSLLRSLRISASRGRVFLYELWIRLTSLDSLIEAGHFDKAMIEQISNMTQDLDKALVDLRVKARSLQPFKLHAETMKKLQAVTD